MLVKLGAQLVFHKNADTFTKRNTYVVNQNATFSGQPIIRFTPFFTYEFMTRQELDFHGHIGLKKLNTSNKVSVI